MAEGKVTIGHLKSEHARLFAEEEGRKRDYFGSRSELQEIWDKLVSLRTHISKFQNEIENAKIEEIMKGAGSIMASNYSATSVDHGHQDTAFTLDAAERVATLNKLKDKIRLRDVLKARVSMLEEKIVEGRKQLFRVTEALKSAPAGGDDEDTVNTSMNSRAGSKADSSVNRTLALRQAILTISDKINTWEDELVHARGDYKDLDAELTGAISAATMGEFTNHTYGNNSLAEITQEAKTSSSSAMTPAKSTSATSTTTSALQSVRKMALCHPNAGTGGDDGITDIIAHGPPLSTGLIAALRSGTELSSVNSFASADAGHMSLLQDCEYSVYEVVTGQAAITRINGEAPAVYIMRLQRRLGSLLTLELQIQLEFQAKVAQVKQFRDLLRDVEVKRLRVELQLSNAQNALRLQQPQLAGTDAYLPSTLTTPYASVGRSIAFVRAGGVKPGDPLGTSVDQSVMQRALDHAGSYEDGGDGGGRGASQHRHNELTSGARQTQQTASASSPVRGRSPQPKTPQPRSGRKKVVLASPERDFFGTPFVTSTAAKATTTTTTPTVSAAQHVHTPAAAVGTPSEKGISFQESSKHAASILRSIIHEQSERISVRGNTTDSEPLSPIFSPEHSAEKGRIRTAKSPSTHEIQHRIVSYMRNHHLDPHTHYAGIIKAIKIQVLSQLLSRDMSSQEVHHTAMLMAVSSPPATAVKGTSSHRLHRYFGSENQPISPIPLPFEYQALAQVAAEGGSAEGLPSLLESPDHSPSPQHSPQRSPHTPMTVSTMQSTLSSSGEEGDVARDGGGSDRVGGDVGHDGDRDEGAHASAHLSAPIRSVSPTRFQYPNAIRDAAASPSKKKVWVAGSKSSSRSNAPVESKSEQIQRLAARALHTAVSALSETFKEEQWAQDTPKGRSKGSNSKGKLDPWRHHSSVRRNCSCAGCRAASLQGESTDDYDYRTGYNRHGHRIGPASAEVGAAAENAEAKAGEALVQYGREDTETANDTAAPAEQAAVSSTPNMSGPANTKPVASTSSSAPQQSLHAQEQTPMLAAVPRPPRAPSPQRMPHLSSHDLESPPRKEVSPPAKVSTVLRSPAKRPAQLAPATVGSPPPSNKVPNRPSSGRTASAAAAATPARSSATATHTGHGAAQRDVHQPAPPASAPAPAPAGTSNVASASADNGRRSPLRYHRYCEICMAVANLPMPPASHNTTATDYELCANANCPRVADAHISTATDSAGHNLLAQRGVANPSSQHDPSRLNPPLVPDLGAGRRPGSRSASPLRGGHTELPHAVTPQYTPAVFPHHAVRMSSPLPHVTAGDAKGTASAAAVGGWEPSTLQRSATGRVIATHRQDTVDSVTSWTPLQRNPLPTPAHFSVRYPEQLPAQVDQGSQQYTQLLSMLQQQQREIDALKHPAAPPVTHIQQTPAHNALRGPESTPFTPFVRSNLHPVALNTAESSVGHIADGTVPQCPRLEQPQPLSTAKPRLGGGGGCSHSVRSSDRSGQSTPRSHVSAPAVMTHFFAAPTPNLSDVRQTLPHADTHAGQRVVHAAPSRTQPADHAQESWTPNLKAPAVAVPAFPPSLTAHTHATSVGDASVLYRSEPQPTVAPTPVNSQSQDSRAQSTSTLATPAPTQAPASTRHTEIATTDPTVQAILRCLRERIQRLTTRWQQAQQTERLHPEYGIAVNADGTSRAYVEVTVLCAKNLPEMKRLTRSCDAYVEILLCTQMSATNGYRAHQMHLNTSVLPSNRVHDRHTLLSLSHGGQRLIDVNFWDERVDDPHHGVLTNAFWRSSVQAGTLFPEWREYFHLSGVTYPPSQVLVFTVRDCAAAGQQPGGDDKVVGCAVLPLTAPLLRDQHPHNLWLPLQAPIQHAKYGVHHRLREGCALKVEVKVHVSEQRYWADLRAEAELIEQKVLHSLSKQLGTSAVGAADDTSRSMELTPAEGRKLEKWLDAMHAAKFQAASASAAAHAPRAVSMDASQGSEMAVIRTPVSALPSRPVDQPAPATQSSAGEETEREQPTDDTTAESDHHNLHPYQHHTQQPLLQDPPAPAPSLPSLPLAPLAPPAPTARSETLSHRDGTRQDALFHAPPLAQAPAPSVPQAAPANQRPQQPRTPVPSSAVPAAAEGRSTSTGRERRGTAHKFVGLREENNRDLFLKSLRNDSVSLGPKSAQKSDRRSATEKRPSTTTAPPPLPVQLQLQTPHPSERQRKLDEVARLQAELAAMDRSRAAHRGPTSPLRIELPSPPKSTSSTLSSVAAGPSRSAQRPPPPPPLPYHVLQTPGRVDLSIFKRAGSDPIYQREVRADVGHKLQHRAEVTNEKLGFLGSGVRQFKMS